MVFFRPPRTQSPSRPAPMSTVGGFGEDEDTVQEDIPVARWKAPQLILNARHSPPSLPEVSRLLQRPRLRFDNTGALEETLGGDDRDQLSKPSSKSLLDFPGVDSAAGQHPGSLVIQRSVRPTEDSDSPWSNAPRSASRLGVWSEAYNSTDRPRSVSAPPVFPKADSEPRHARVSSRSKHLSREVSELAEAVTASLSAHDRAVGGSSRRSRSGSKSRGRDSSAQAEIPGNSESGSSSTSLLEDAGTTLLNARPPPAALPLSRSKQSPRVRAPPTNLMSTRRSVSFSVPSTAISRFVSDALSEIPRGTISSDISPARDGRPRTRSSSSVDNRVVAPTPIGWERQLGLWPLNSNSSTAAPPSLSSGRSLSVLGDLGRSYDDLAKMVRVYKSQRAVRPELEEPRRSSVYVPSPLNPNRAVPSHLRSPVKALWSSYDRPANMPHKRRECDSGQCGSCRVCKHASAAQYMWYYNVRLRCWSAPTPPSAQAATSG